MLQPCDVRSSAPAGHLILALSGGPPVDRVVCWCSGSAGSPHRSVASRSGRAGPPGTISWVSIDGSLRMRALCPAARRLADRATGRQPGGLRLAGFGVCDLAWGCWRGTGYVTVTIAVTASATPRAVTWMGQAWAVP